MSAQIDRIPRPMKGMNWEPAPTSYAKLPAPQEFGDTDFANADFAALWDVDAHGVGRHDLKTIADLGCNTVKLYNWSVPAPAGYWGRDHKPFLAKAKTLGLHVIIPVSSYFTHLVYQDRVSGNTNSEVPSFIFEMVKEIYQNGAPIAAVLWAIGNEYDLSPIGSGSHCEARDIAAVAAYIVAAEKALGIDPTQGLAFTSPVSTALKPTNSSITVTAPYDTLMGGCAIKMLADAFDAALTPQVAHARFIAAVNSYQVGQQLKDYHAKFAQVFAGMPFFYGEIGRDAANSDTDQADTIYNQFSTILPLAQPGSHFHGACLFEFSDELWKGPPRSTEAMFGIYTFANTPNPPMSKQAGHAPMWDAAYPVDALTARPAAAYLRAALSGKPKPDGVA